MRLSLRATEARADSGTNALKPLHAQPLVSKEPWSAYVLDATHDHGSAISSDARKICRAFDAADERDSTEIGI